MSTVVLETPRVETAKWIIGKRDDLIWFVGAPLAGYAALAIMTGARSWAYPLFVVWWSFINMPHIFGTASRTYFVKTERQKLSRLLWLIVPLTLIPIAAVKAGLIVPLFIFSVFWGNWHVAKQHFGFVMLYKRKNGERSDLTIDKVFVLLSQILPFVMFILWYLSIPVFGREILGIALLAQLILLGVYVHRQIVKYRAQEEMNWPKLMLLALITPLHWLAFFVASRDLVNGMFIFTIATNIGHALQYHRLTWFHNKNRFQGQGGLSGLLSKNAGFYYLAGFGLYLVFVGSSKLFPSVGSELILTGPTFMHYVLDTRIWRVRGDQDLARALRL